ncbi:hypothetical protein PHYSODRAFT_473727, partial [Phytophthora sojae]
LPRLAARSSAFPGKRDSSTSNRCSTDSTPTTTELSVLGVNAKAWCRHCDRSLPLPQCDLVPISTVFKNRWATSLLSDRHGKRPCRHCSFLVAPFLAAHWSEYRIHRERLESAGSENGFESTYFATRCGQMQPVKRARPPQIDAHLA